MDRKSGLAAALAAFLMVAPGGAQTVKAGSGAYWLSGQGGDRDVPPAPMRTDELR